MFSVSFLFFIFAPILCQTLNSWGQTVFDGGGGSAGHYLDQAVDGNVSTYLEGFGLPDRLGILLNRVQSFSGFYVQSSGAFITDYYVTAYDYTTYTEPIIGRVSNATSNLTAVNFYSSEGASQVYTDTIFLWVTDTQNGNTAIINEIWPIYPGDTIVYQPGQSAQPSPTQTVVSTTTSAPTTSIYPPPTASGITLNTWPSTTNGGPFVQNAALTDGDPNTLYSEALPTSNWLLFNNVHTYDGFYVLSESPIFITDYYVSSAEPDYIC